MQLGTPLGASAEFQSEVGDRVFFGEGSAQLGARARAALAAQAAWLARNQAASVIVEGHADDAGAAEHNLEISLRRAEAVRRRLIESGVAPERIHVRAFGRERLIADCAAAACTAQNRRAVTIVGAPDGETAVEPSLLPGTAVRRSPRRLY